MTAGFSEAGRFSPVLLITLLLLLLAAAPSGAGISDAFELQAEPTVLLPGGVFRVTVTAAGRAAAPAGSFGGSPLLFGPCGDGCYVALGAADLKAKPGRHDLEVQLGNTRKRIPIRVQKHQFPVVHLTLPPGKVSPTEEDNLRIEREEKLLKALWAEKTEKGFEGSFVLPLDSDISTGFGVVRIINKEKESIHRGIDMRGKEGDEVRASNSGRIVLAEELFFGGRTLVLDHGLGIFSVYMHLSEFRAKRGDRVAKGEVVGYVGSTGRSTGPHLHYGIKVQQLSADPVSVTTLKL